jgi:Cu+-exporting ATPase
MTHKKIIFQDSFLLSGIMCFTECGETIQSLMNACLQECKKDNLVPHGAELSMDAEPQALGVHRLFITITHNAEEIELSESVRAQISARFKESVDFMYIDDLKEENKKEAFSINWLNIIINLIAIGVISALSLLLAPSLLLTIGLTLISFLTTAFTARSYLINFLKNLRQKNFFNMNTTVTLGWSLSLAHTLYHAISMPLLSGFPMMFMCFIMPIMLITIINGMDEIKRRILKQSKKMHLKGMKMLFPEMAVHYACYQLLQLDQELLFPPIEKTLSTMTPEAFFQRIEYIIKNNKQTFVQKTALKEGMLITVRRGTCFPVDCTLLYGQTIVDSSLLTGEPQQIKKCLDFIPAGAINLGEDVVVRSINDPYRSTINQLLFRSNRTKQDNTVKSSHKFHYLYASLIGLGIGTSIITPWALGILTFSLFAQNFIGILFAICFCTLAIALKLPPLLSRYQRTNHGIILGDEKLCTQNNKIKTVVFDKTGTLTTGNSQVESYEGISVSLWHRIYLLEKHYGGGHPIAKSIMRYYERKVDNPIIIQNIEEPTKDPNNRGLSALVQGRRIHIGSADYLQRSGITIPKFDSNKIEKGFTPVYIAQDNKYKGVIYIKHEVRKEALTVLQRLKDEGVNIIMVTGDTASSAQRFNEQNGSIFDVGNIYAEQSPQDKENTILSLMKDQESSGFWFIGDGINDGPCSKTVTEKGGVSCSITSEDKSSFFTEINLNGSFNYLFHHKKLNNFVKKNIFQNKGLLMFSALSSIAFIISFSIAGIAVSPIIPLLVMALTTFKVLFNSYRVQLNVDCTLNQNSFWLKKLFASDVSIGLLAGASLSFMCGLLISTIATGGLALPVITFVAGAAAAISSVCLLAAAILCVTFIVMAATYLILNRCLTEQGEPESPPPSPLQPTCTDSPEAQPENEDKHYSSLWKQTVPTQEKNPEYSSYSALSI